MGMLRESIRGRRTPSWSRALFHFRPVVPYLLPVTIRDLGWVDFFQERAALRPAGDGQLRLAVQFRLALYLRAYPSRGGRCRSGTHGTPWGGENGKRASQCTAQVVGGIAMAAWKSRTAQLQNLGDVGGRHASCQQGASDPQVHDAPVRLQESLRNVPAPHPGLVDFCGLRAG